MDVISREADLPFVHNGTVLKSCIRFPRVFRGFAGQAVQYGAANRAAKQPLILSALPTGSAHDVAAADANVAEIRPPAIGFYKTRDIRISRKFRQPVWVKRFDFVVRRLPRLELSPGELALSVLLQLSLKADEPGIAVIALLAVYKTTALGDTITLE